MIESDTIYMNTLLLIPKHLSSSKKFSKWFSKQKNKMVVPCPKVAHNKRHKGGPRKKLLKTLYGDFIEWIEKVALAHYNLIYNFLNYKYNWRQNPKHPFCKCKSLTLAEECCESATFHATNWTDRPAYIRWWWVFLGVGEQEAGPDLSSYAWS